MNWKITFHFFICTLITLVSSSVFASPAGMHNFHNQGKEKIVSIIAPSGYSTCSLNELGWVYCWGSNAGGQIGNNTITNSNKPIPIRSGFIQLDNARSSGGSTSGTTYAITKSGVLMSWGDNIFGKLGTGSDSGASFTPQIVNPTIRYKFLKAQYRHTCAITTSNALRCWGYNTDGNLGDGTTVQKVTPTVIDSGVNYKSVAVGAFGTCGITTANVLKCWGLNADGEVGDGSTTQRLSPVVVDSGVTYASVSQGLSHTCAITIAGVLKCWGSDSFGQLGDGGIYTSRSSPYTIDSGTSYVMVSLGDDTSCGITTAGVLKCWGANGDGQIGDGSTTTRPTPVVVDSGTTYISVATSGYHTCGVTTGKVMKCWGLNNLGQLGIGNLTSYTTPQVVSPP